MRIKKWLVVVIALVLTLTLSSAIYASTASLVGKKVQGEVAVTLNDKEISKGIIIDGVTYIPVRSAAVALSVEVGYKPGEVKLLDERKKILGRINILNSQIQFFESGIENANMILDRYSEIPDYFNETEKQIYKDQIEAALLSIEENTQKIAELEEQRDKLLEELNK